MIRWEKLGLSFTFFSVSIKDLEPIKVAAVLSLELFL